VVLRVNAKAYKGETEQGKERGGCVIGQVFCRPRNDGKGGALGPKKKITVRFLRVRGEILTAQTEGKGEPLAT